MDVGSREETGAKAFSTHQAREARKRQWRPLHRLCYDAKANYWLRAQLPHHANRLVDSFREQQMRLVASYHGVCDKAVVESRWPIIHEWCERATSPTENGGMAMRSMGVVALATFACSLAASLKRVAIIFPDWISLGQRGDLLQTSREASPEMSAQVLHYVGEYRRRAPQGLFKESDDFSAGL